jgi:hypothetical protein
VYYYYTTTSKSSQPYYTMNKLLVLPIYVCKLFAGFCTEMFHVPRACHGTAPPICHWTRSRLPMTHLPPKSNSSPSPEINSPAALLSPRRFHASSLRFHRTMPSRSDDVWALASPDAAWRFRDDAELEYRTGRARPRSRPSRWSRTPSIVFENGIH